MKNKIINTVFIVCIFIFLLAGLCRTVFMPKDLNTYENRYAKKMISPAVVNLLDGTFQDTTESALADQVFFAEGMKKAYNDTNARYTQPFLNAISRASGKMKYMKLGDVNLFGENLVYSPSDFAIIESALEKKANDLNAMFDRHKDIEFYMYYIEKDTDINFETNEKIGAYEYLYKNINLPDNKKARFKTDSFKDFKENFYVTDHHWNATGSYKGYCEVFDLLECTGKKIEPIDSSALPGAFKGSKTQGEKTAAYSEEFVVNRFDFPEMKIKINGADAEDYGQQQNYKVGKEENPSYALYYGDDMGEIIFDTGDSSKESILLIGESYDNAILKLIASHFNKTYSIDLRFYTAYMGKEFHLAEYLRKNNIKKVLLIGNIDYYVSDEFTPED